MVDVTWPKWDDGRLPGKHEVGRFRLLLTRTQPSFAQQYNTDFRQTKTAVCVLARSAVNLMRVSGGCLRLFSGDGV